MPAYRFKQRFPFIAPRLVGVRTAKVQMHVFTTVKRPLHCYRVLRVIAAGVAHDDGRTLRTPELITQRVRLATRYTREHC
jgi:hypothetical protein